VRNPAQRHQPGWPVTLLRDLLGVRGTLLLAETDFPGSSLYYLEYLGATPTWLPKPLEKAIGAGIPRPSHSGSAELAECFPLNQWQPLLTQATDIVTVSMWGSANRRPCRAGSPSCERTQSSESERRWPVPILRAVHCRSPLPGAAERPGR